MPDLTLPDRELADRARWDFTTAETAQVPVRDRKLSYYQLYRNYRDDVTGGGQTEPSPGQTGSRGPFNWSRLSIPIVWWTVEGFTSRITTEAPTITAVPLTPDAVPYAQAKQLRIGYYLARIGWGDLLSKALKDFTLLGDGFTKTSWDPKRHLPRVTYIPWTDFFVSPEAQDIEDAEVLYHRTWHTRRSLEELAKLRDGQGRPMYRNLDQVAMGSDRTAADPTWATRRIWAGGPTAQFARTEDQQVPFVECHYADGTVLTIGGANYSTLVRAVVNPYVDPDGEPWRPFDSFANTLDPQSPYAIGDAEMLEDCQREAQTIIDQSIDQAARNINRAVVYNRQQLSPEQVDAGLGVPGGKIGVDGDPRNALYEMAAPQLSADSEAVISRIINVAQMVSGITDESQGMTPRPRPGQDDTGATGAVLRAQERNRRVQYKLWLIANAVRRIACKLDWLDLQYARERDLPVPVPEGFVPKVGAEGIDLHPTGELALVKGQPRSGEHRYEIKIDAGSLDAPIGNEQATRAINLARILLDPKAQLGDIVNKAEMARILVEASGFEPSRIIAPHADQAAQPAPGAPPPPPPAPPAGAPPAPAGLGAIGLPPGPLGPGGPPQGLPGPLPNGPPPVMPPPGPPVPVR